MVVVGFDGSTTSEHALHYAAGLADRQGSELVVVHALTMPYDPLWTGQTAADTLTRASLEKSVHELAAERGVTATFVTAFGDAATVLTRIADEEKADAIVVGASTTPVHKLFGSTAVRAVRQCPCPVTVVP